jgi:hypothetical protein
MTTTLQQALIKAGLVKEKLPEKKPEKTTILKSGKSHAPSPPVTAKPGFIERKHHHHLRTLCDACQKSGPDVEYYEHKNRSLDAKWLCVKCADTYNIPDNCRETMQSQFSITGRFIRNYGATKVFK